jgi:excisionase family DNA binding protein
MNTQNPDEQLQFDAAITDAGLLLTVAQLATRWSMSRATIYRALEDGLPSLKLGRSRRIRVSDADQWLNEQAAASTQAGAA